MCDRFLLLLLLSYIVFDVLILFPLLKKLNLNAKLLNRDESAKIQNMLFGIFYILMNYQYIFFLKRASKFYDSEVFLGLGLIRMMMAVCLNSQGDI